MAGKRRLPLLQTSAGADEDAPQRSAGQWVLFGALIMLVVWLPLAWVVPFAGLKLGGDLWVVAVLLPIAFFGGLVVATVAGGFLLGRWGDRNVGVREAALAGLMVGSLALVLNAWGHGFRVEHLLVLLFSTPSAAVGGILGLRARKP